MDFGKWVKQNNCQGGKKGTADRGEGDSRQRTADNVDVFIISKGHFFRPIDSMDTEQLS